MGTTNVAELREGGTPRTIYSKPRPPSTEKQ